MVQWFNGLFFKHLEVKGVEGFKPSNLQLKLEDKMFKWVRFLA